MESSPAPLRSPAAPGRSEAPARGPQSADSGRSKKPFLMLGAAVLAGGLVLAGFAALHANQEETDDAQVEADVVPVSGRVGGQVRERKVEDNQRVRKGDILIELDDADFAARAKQAEAELETARAQASAADEQVRVVEASAKGGLFSAKAMYSGSSMAVASAEAQIAAARAGFERAKAEQRRAELDLARAKQLVEASAAPRERLDNAQVSWDAAQAALAQAGAQVAAAEEQRRVAVARVGEARGRLDQSTPIDAQIGAARANAQLAHARVKVSEAALELASLQLSYTKVRAPDDGILSRVSVQPGQWIQPGQVIASLVPERTYVVANFKETQVGRMRAGQGATIRLDAFPGVGLEGRVESLSGGTGSRFSLLPPDNASGNFVKVVQRVPVRIAFAKRPELPLQAGLSADVTVHIR
jgi:membrane fusion protein (multidrug efflux system)